METQTTLDILDNKENGPIDICVMWVNPTTFRWRQEYYQWRTIEILRGTQKSSNLAAFGPARYRDWDIFKYWFRGVEQNCPWVNKIFLVVEAQDQIPNWLNTGHPKLRIIYHKEFIPENALPQFNGPAIETWYSNIPDLSENFISCDDDYFFINPIPEDLFFEHNVPQTVIKENPIVPSPKITANWRKMMYNDYLLLQKITGKDIVYTKSHLPEPRKKSFEAKIIKEYYDDFYKPLISSHFRSDNGITAWIFNDLIKAFGVAQNKPIFKNSRYIGLFAPEALKIDKPIGQLDMVCFNDIGGNIEAIKPKVIEILNNIFPEKSSFEL